MADELPAMLAGGEPARLFPVLAETSKEGRTLSVLLACMANVDDLARTMLATVGQRGGVRMRVRTFTEVTLADEPDELAGRRPDGLIVVETGRRTWSALVEAKVRRSALEADQIEAYLKLARANGIDAVVTISNAFAAVPQHHPVRVSRVPKGVSLFHWSWISILTHAKVLLAAKGVDDPEQRFLLDELVRFLSHASTGVMGFDRMDAHWKGIVASVVAGAALPNSDAVADTVANWHQECRNLALGLMERVNSNVAIRLPRAHRDDPRRRVAEEAERLRGASVLAVEFDVPDAASPIKVEADLRTRSIGVAMTLRAPEDRKSARARANWLLRQLAASDPKDIHVKAVYPGRRASVQESLAKARENPDLLRPGDAGTAPKTFEVRMVRDAGSRFAGAKTFVDELESTVYRFYAEAGQRLRNWQPVAPKMAVADEPPDEPPAEQDRATAHLAVDGPTPT